MKRTWKNIYRVLGTNKASNYYGCDMITRDITFNGKKPLYESNNIDDAVSMFKQLAAENYKEHIILIADFGMLDPDQYMKERLHKFNADRKYDELMPFLIIANYNNPEDFGDGISWNENEIHIYFKNNEHVFDDVVEAMRYLENRMFVDDNVLVKTYDYDEYGHRKIRTLVNSKDFRKIPDYRPCSKIRTTWSTFAEEANFA